MGFSKLNSKDLTLQYILWQKSYLRGFWYDILLSKYYSLLFLGDSGLTSVNEGEYNQYAWNDFYNKKDTTFHSF